MSGQIAVGTQAAMLLEHEKDIQRLRSQIAELTAAIVEIQTAEMLSGPQDLLAHLKAVAQMINSAIANLEAK